jgi:hypothetical protein
VAGRIGSGLHPRVGGAAGGAGGPERGGAPAPGAVVGVKPAGGCGSGPNRELVGAGGPDGGGAV